MCGILIFVTNNSNVCRLCQAKSTGEVEFVNLLKKRGPDITSELCQNISNNTFVHFIGSVLWTQGDFAMKQPLGNGESHLLFNGDIYSFNKGADDFQGGHDAQELYNRLHRAESEQDILEILPDLQGPYTFIFYKNKEILFARDLNGKSSLVFNYYDKDCFSISSLSTWSTALGSPEISSEIHPGLYRINLLNKEEIVHYWDVERSVEMHLPIVNFTQGAKIQRGIPLEDPDTKGRETFLENLSTEILNVEDLISKLTFELNEEILTLEHLLRAAVLRRSKCPPVCKTCTTSTNCDHTKVGVLFSGGLDSAIISFLLAESLAPSDSIDLINVAFHDANGRGGEQAPDRITALQTYRVLRKLFPNKNIKLVLVDVGIDELIEERKNVIRYLIAPLNLVMDDSLGCAMYFAARGKGCLYNQEERGERVEYESTCRVLFVGFGADELFGGYGYHNAAFKSQKWKGLSESVLKDIKRIGGRNLGRDNRVISHHGVSPRHPFLDETLMDYVAALPISSRTAPFLNTDDRKCVGNKMLLRLLASKLFGIENETSFLPKRALQFGSRIARIECRTEKGDEVCSRLQL